MHRARRTWTDSSTCCLSRIACPAIEGAHDLPDQMEPLVGEKFSGHGKQHLELNVIAEFSLAIICCWGIKLLACLHKVPRERRLQDSLWNGSRPQRGSVCWLWQPLLAFVSCSMVWYIMASPDIVFPKAPMPFSKAVVQPRLLRETHFSCTPCLSRKQRDLRMSIGCGLKMRIITTSRASTSTIKRLTSIVHMRCIHAMRTCRICNSAI